MKNGIRETAEDIKLLNQENIRTLLEKENFTYLGILKADYIKQMEMGIIRKITSIEREIWSKPKQQKSQQRDEY